MGVREKERFLEQWRMDATDLRRRMILAPTPRERERWYAILLLAQGLTAAATAEGNPFNIESSLTVPQKNGDADVLVSYPAVTHLIGKTRGPISRIPGRVIGWRTNQVEVIYPGQGQDEYIKVWVAYGDDFDPADLHDDKQNIASCRFAKIGGWPIFKECSKVN